jgi:fluoroacetyl-CoA thioesterase
MKPPDTSAPEDATLSPGLVGRATAHVTDALTAPALGSGSIAVYATPAMAALMEQAAVECADRHLKPGEATVGVALDLKHTAATPPGLDVTAEATLTAVDGRKLTFAIVARDAAGPIGEAAHTRLVVDVARFEAKLAAKRQLR